MERLEIFHYLLVFINFNYGWSGDISLLAVVDFYGIMENNYNYGKIVVDTSLWAETNFNYGEIGDILLLAVVNFNYGKIWDISLLAVINFYYEKIGDIPLLLVINFNYWIVKMLVIPIILYMKHIT